jgi:hypothetical protein
LWGDARIAPTDMAGGAVLGILFGIVFVLIL